MKILNECSFIDKNNIERIEKHYNGKYIFESCLKLKNGNWANFPVAIFYTEKAHPEGSNYFAIYRDTDGHYGIANGITAIKDITYVGLKVDDTVIYSRYRHDCRSVGDVFVDGGRDYFRFSGPQENLVKFKVSKDKLEIITEGN